MKVLLKVPGEELVEIELPESDDIKTQNKVLQKHVGGVFDFINVTGRIMAVVNDFGRVDGSPLNVLGLFGTVVFIRINPSGYIVALTDKDVEHVKELCRKNKPLPTTVVS